ncbi:hypothetical protein ACTXT7_016013 [Hymenolepis weldensis]
MSDSNVPNSTFYLPGLLRQFLSVNSNNQVLQPAPLCLQLLRGFGVMMMRIIFLFNHAPPHTQ